MQQRDYAILKKKRLVGRIQFQDLFDIFGLKIKAV